MTPSKERSNHTERDLDLKTLWEDLNEEPPAEPRQLENTATAGAESATTTS